MELSGKVAFVTGAANGLGNAYVEALLKEGVKVMMTDIDEVTGSASLADLGNKYGSENVRFMKLDVTNERDWEDVFKAAVTAFGQVDIMVNNAGVMNEGQWQLMIKINVFGVVKGTKLAEQHMRKDKGGKGGRIINISSMAGIIDTCLLPVYCGTKHAVRSFTMSQAGQFDLAAQGIEYGLICPTQVDTDLIRSSDASKVNFYDLSKDMIRDTMPISKVVEGFMELIKLEKINGAIKIISKEKNTFAKLEASAIGPDYVAGFSSPITFLKE